MNRCEEVLKHSTNKGLKIEKDELYHSDTYLGSEYDEGLKHWKYIKRYRSPKTGKWVYVYQDKMRHELTKENEKKMIGQRNSQLFYERLSKRNDADPRITNQLTRNVQDRLRAKKFKEEADYYQNEVQSSLDDNDIKKLTIKKVKDAVYDAKIFIKHLLHSH